MKDENFALAPRQPNGEYPVMRGDQHIGWVCRHLSFWSYGRPGEAMLSYANTRKEAVENLLAAIG